MEGSCRCHSVMGAMTPDRAVVIRRNLPTATRERLMEKRGADGKLVFAGN